MRCARNGHQLRNRRESVCVVLLCDADLQLGHRRNFHSREWSETEMTLLFVNWQCSVTALKPDRSVGLAKTARPSSLHTRVAFLRNRPRLSIGRQVSLRGALARREARDVSSAVTRLTRVPGEGKCRQRTQEREKEGVIQVEGEIKERWKWDEQINTKKEWRVGRNGTTEERYIWKKYEN
jgi:hypothetical protein